MDRHQHQVLVDRKRGRGYATETASTGRIASTVLRGFWIDAAWLWTKPLPNKLACLREILA